MSELLDLYEEYLKTEKKASANTVSSYLRDMRQFEAAMTDQDTELEEVLTNKQRALEAFLGQSISQEDFLFLNHRWDSHITELRQQLTAVRKETAGKQDAGQDIRAAIQACIQTNAAESSFCTQLLDHMTVSADGRVEVTLRFLSARWVFALVLPSECEPSEVAHSESSVPISVNNPLSSG